MTVINTPISATATNTQAEDTVQNPTQVVGGTDGASGQIVHVTLRFTGGLTFDPNVLYDGINSAYGTVASIKETVARDTYIFNIEA